MVFSLSVPFSFIQAKACAWLLIGSFCLQAQPTERWDLAAVQAWAQVQSPAAKLAQLRWQAADFRYQVFRSTLNPRIALSGYAPGLTRQIEHLVLDDGSQNFITRSQSFSSLNLVVEQAIPFTGGKISLSSGLFHIRNFAPQQTDFWQSTPLLLQLEQPLFRPNRYRWDQRQALAERRFARLQFHLAQAQASLTATEQYFEALLARIDLEGAQANLGNNDTVLLITRKRYNIGKSPEAALLQSQQRQVEAEGLHQQAQLRLDYATRRLARFLGLPRPGLEGLPLPGGWPQVELDPEWAVARAQAHAATLAQIRLDALAQQRERAESQAEQGIQADIIASFGLNQTGADLGEAYQSPVDRQYATIGVQIPLWQGGKRRAERSRLLAEAQALKVSEQIQEQELAHETRQLVLRLKQLQTQLSRSAQVDSLAGRRYAITLSRYLIGKVSIQELFLAQQEKDLARQQYLLTLRDGWMSYQRLRLLTLYDIEHERPLLDADSW